MRIRYVHVLVVGALAVVAAACCVALTQAPAATRVGPAKVIRVAFPTAETGFDPQAAGDEYSGSVNRVIFDPLYRYDYLARPMVLVPRTLVAMPVS